jgi:FkbM family methyltransferase
MKKLFRLIPHEFRWRLGRALYMDARGDFKNEMSTNGELFLQRWMIDKYLARRRKEKDVYFFDIGANRGEWTSNLLQYLDRNKYDSKCVYIHLFEPDPTAYEILKTRFEKNENLLIEKIAISSRSGKARFFMVGKASGTNSLYKHTEKEIEFVEIQTETIDNYCQKKGIRHIDFVKIDTEGHDFEVILGAEKMMKNGSISIIQFEYNWLWIFARRFLKDVFDLISEVPYVIGKIQPDKIIIFEKWHYELERFFEGNYVLIHEEEKNRFPIRFVGWNKYNTMVYKK